MMIQEEKVFGVAGGDSRQVWLIRSLLEDGHTVYTTGLEKAPLDKRARQVSFSELAELCSVIIFPLPVTTDGVHLNAPFSREPLLLGEETATLLKGKSVYGGMVNRLYRTGESWEKVSVFDYLRREELAVRNAIPTAEGAIQLAMEKYPGTLNGSKCLVTGFGRIGKVLSGMLRGLGAQVTVSARKPEDLAWIRLSGYEAVHTRHPGSGYDMIFNTVPALVFTREVLSRLEPGTLLIDLASAPGGVDRESAEILGIPVLPALSLPGKVAPKAAGEIIKETIYHMMEE